MKNFVLVLLAAGLVVAMGCRKASETTAEKMMEKAIAQHGGGQAKVDLEKDKVTVKTKEGEFVATSGGGAEVPADFPKDVLVYKNAAIQLAITNPDAFVLNLISKDGADKVTEAYTAAMKGAGWEQAGMVNMGGQVVLSYTKDKRNATVSVAKDSQGTRITLSVVKPHS